MTRADHARVAEWDAAYVLGSLSPAERREYEEHLEDCPRCRAAVGELSALPGLLGRIDDARAFALLDPPADGNDAPHPAGDDLVARITARDRGRTTARRIRMIAGLAAAAALAVILTLAVQPLVSPAPEPALAAQLQPVGDDVPVEASIELTRVSWGTRIDMDCGYHAPAGSGADAGYGPAAYAMWVVGRDGSETALSTWNADPARRVQVTAGTALALEDIAEVEVRTASGDRVLLAAALNP